jgi:spore coat polysaccharide biosynthesis protein SpsF (cytidylyltransferase family)
MDVIAIIQARLSSTRLPNKVFEKLEGVTIIERVVARVRACRDVDTVVVATTVNASDLPLVALCAAKGVSVFCGSEDDVLDRYYQAARAFGAQTVVRITADCPLMDPGVMSTVVRAHLTGGSDYTSNVVKPSFPDGEDVEAFSFAALEKAWREARLLSEREHVTQYFLKNPGLFTLRNCENGEDLSALRWTVDTAEDLEFIRQVYARLARPDERVFGLREVCDLLREHPEIVQINSQYTRNEGLAKSLREDAIRGGPAR